MWPFQTTFPAAERTYVHGAQNDLGHITAIVIQVVNHLTARLKAALETIDIRVIDYIAIGETMHTRIAASAGWIAIDL